ncbi:MAG: bifunctional glutamine synthetase adenylyltransferase/deadenyltransferase, partial [Gammaproteobacteria bacterium]|nr:bifunctional glutamine synthetase adenylyltransferase/deadenyltransferase [Gammaproteobacteria bacterium]
MQPDLTSLPPTLAEAARAAWQHILERAPAPLAAQLETAAAASPTAAQLPRVLACSPFVADLCRRQPALLLELMGSGQLHKSLQESVFRSDLQRRLEAGDTETGVVLRRYRQWHMLRIIWRDFCRLADTRETVRDTSLLAEACIGAALETSQAALEVRFGVPRGRHG